MTFWSFSKIRQQKFGRGKERERKKKDGEKMSSGVFCFGKTDPHFDRQKKFRE